MKERSLRKPDDPSIIDKLFDRFFDETLDPFGGLPWMEDLDLSSLSDPLADVYENKRGEVVIELDVPGFDPKKLNVEVTDKMVRVSAKAEENQPAEEKDKKFYQLERRATAYFEKAFALASYIDLESASATFKNGVLTIVLQKKDRAEVTKRIEVKAE